MPSYVIVWENNTFGHQKVKGHTWPGHVSMNIGQTIAFMNGDIDQNYVSFWPGETAFFNPKGALFGKNTKAVKKWSIIEDMSVEKYLPDHVIEMETTEDKEKAMLAAWKAIANKAGGTTYKTLRKNCSTIVSRILHAGGFYAKKWAVDCNFAWTPADVKRLALKAGGRAMQWTEFLTILEASQIKPSFFMDSQGQVITMARSGKYCSTGAPCKFQPQEVDRRHAVELD